MTTKDEALKLALEKLESVLCDPDGNVCWHGSYADRDIIGNALDVFRTAIKQALAAPVQESSEADELLVNLGLDPQAYRTDGGAINYLKVKAAMRHPAEYPVKREHITDCNPCWCNPETDYVDPETGIAVIVHKEPQ